MTAVGICTGCDQPKPLRVDGMIAAHRYGPDGPLLIELPPASRTRRPTMPCPGGGRPPRQPAALAGERPA